MIKPIKVPFIDLRKQYESIKGEVDEAMTLCFEQSQFVGGKKVTGFEKNFSEYLGVDHCISCANGTDALEIILKALGLGPGDEVIVPAVTWISTAEAVSSVGATPVFADIEPGYYTINPNNIEERINQNTKAIIPVHLYGQPCDMSRLISIARKNGLYLIEDCAQAHGAKINGQKVGTLGDCASFSFYPGKNLGAYGDGGCMITDKMNLAEKLRLISNHGQKIKHRHIIEGRNSRLDTIQAAVLDIKLKYLDSWNEKRRECANRYLDSFKDLKEVLCPEIRANSDHAFHLFVIRAKDREGLMNFLKSRNIATNIHYPKALPDVECYSHLSHKSDNYPVSRLIHNEIVSLPIFPEITNEQIDYVINSVIEFYK